MIEYRERVSRRRFVKGAMKVGLASFAATMFARSACGAEPAELKLPEGLAAERWDFETKGVNDWKIVTGQWAIEDMAGAPSGKRVLVQRALENTYNVIVAPSGPYSDVEVSMKFKP